MVYTFYLDTCALIDFHWMKSRGFGRSYEDAPYLSSLQEFRHFLSQLHRTNSIRIIASDVTQAEAKGVLLEDSFRYDVLYKEDGLPLPELARHAREHQGRRMRYYAKHKGSRIAEDCNFIEYSPTVVRRSAQFMKALRSIRGSVPLGFQDASVFAGFMAEGADCFVTSDLKDFNRLVQNKLATLWRRKRPVRFLNPRAWHKEPFNNRSVLWDVLRSYKKGVLLGTVLMRYSDKRGTLSYRHIIDRNNSLRPGNRVRVLGRGFSPTCSSLLVESIEFAGESIKEGISDRLARSLIKKHQDALGIRREWIGSEDGEEYITLGLKISGPQEGELVALKGDRVLLLS